MSKELCEPPASRSLFSTVSNELHYLWGGSGSGVEPTSINTYNLLTEMWTVRQTRGTPHPGLEDGGCTAIHNKLYCFGGCNERSRFNEQFYSNELTVLDLESLQWSRFEHRSQPTECPKRKCGCGLVAVDDNTLACFGGVGRELRHTNELHLFDIITGVWSSPGLHGEMPPPLCCFSFTKVDQHRAVLFGGTKLSARSQRVFIFDFITMTVVELKAVSGEPWPTGRSLHGACCLNYGGDSPQLLVFGGHDGQKILNDMWLMAANKWTEVYLSELVKGRIFHSLTATSLEPGVSEVLLFGGETKKSVNSPIAGTTILRFECRSGKWTLVNEEFNSSRTSKRRLCGMCSETSQTTSVYSTVAESNTMQS